ncbi:MAG: hypothetical protein ABSG15_09030 [FCB group bacterium]|jgi:hypothetical protein
METRSQISVVKKGSAEEEEFLLKKLMLKEIKTKITEMINNNDPAIIKTLKQLIAQDEISKK